MRFAAYHQAKQPALALIQLQKNGVPETMPAVELIARTNLLSVILVPSIRRTVRIFKIGRRKTV
jgi:hypothetical protein